jgi:nucleoside-diphosphate-sugar epimerase
MAEQVSQLYRKIFNIIDIRLSNVYGPTHLIRPDLIPTILYQIFSENKTVSVWTKKPVRDFVYVKDVVDAIMLLLNTDFSGPINVGSGIGRSVGEVCDIIENLCHKKILTDDIPVTGHMKYVHDLTLLNSLIPYNPTDLEKGLRDTVDYMNQNYSYWKDYSKS